jgi:hypothetical protein
MLFAKLVIQQSEFWENRGSEPATDFAVHLESQEDAPQCEAFSSRSVPGAWLLSQLL